jgi:hypothetical protein
LDAKISQRAIGVRAVGFAWERIIEPVCMPTSDDGFEILVETRDREEVGEYILKRFSILV